MTIGAFVAGYGIRTAVQTALSLGQIGEFSFIIAGVGLSLGVTRSFLYPVAVAVSALTTLLTPFMIRASGRIGACVDRRLPHALQTYAALYGAWVQGLRATPEHRTAWSRIRRLARLLVLDAALCAAHRDRRVVVGARARALGCRASRGGPRRGPGGADRRDAGAAVPVRAGRRAVGARPRRGAGGRGLARAASGRRRSIWPWRRGGRCW